MLTPLFMKSRLVARTQGILTQLIFDRTMRVRLHGVTEDAKSPSSSPSADTPEASTDQNGDLTSGETETLIGSVEAERDGATIGEEATKSLSTTGVSMGTLNNLVSTDINNLETGQYWILNGKSGCTYDCCRLIPL